MSGPLEVVATIHVQPGRIDEVVAILAGQLETTRAEAGCLRYDLHRDRRDPETLVMLERWASKEALRAHGETAHFVEASRRLSGLLASAPAVRVLDPVLAEAPSP